MSIVKEKYSSNRVNLIYQMLCNEAEQAQPKEYDVRVDELKVVSRTSDPERFFQHEDFILPDTRYVTVCLYDGGSRRCTRYVLLLKEEESATKGALDGIEHTMGEKLQQERRQWQYELLQKENEDLKARLADAEEYQEQLQDTVRQMQGEKSSTTNKITETVLNFAGLYFSKNPQVLGGIPLLSDLVNSGSTPPQPQQSTETASYSKQESGDAGNIKPTEQNTTTLRKTLILLFPELYAEKVERIIQYLYVNNELADQLLRILQQACPDEEEEDETELAA